MSSTKKRIATYLSDEEYEQMVASAQKAGLSLSKFVKCVCTEVAQFVRTAFTVF
jgi:hypothetical protein